MWVASAPEGSDRAPCGQHGYLCARRGHEAGEGELVGAGLLHGEYPGVAVHPLRVDGAVRVEDLVFFDVRVRLVAGE